MERLKEEPGLLQQIRVDNGLNWSRRNFTVGARGTASSCLYPARDAAAEWICRALQRLVPREFLDAYLFEPLSQVRDGDTLTAKCPDETIKLRLAEIDAPEKKQPFGNKSAQSLSNLCFKQEARIQPLKLNRFRRTAADISCREKDVGRHQVQNGMAMVYDQYVTDQPLYDIQATLMGTE